MRATVVGVAITVALLVSSGCSLPSPSKPSSATTPSGIAARSPSVAAWSRVAAGSADRRAEGISTNDLRRSDASGTGAFAGRSASTAVGSCPVTEPEGQSPAGRDFDRYALGNGMLWTALWPYGLVLVPADDVDSDGSLEMKFPWWRGAGARGILRIHGRELTRGLPIRANVRDGYGMTGFQSTGITFPVEGCYEITGEAGGAQLTFVTMVRSCSALVELPPAARTQYAICGP